MKCLVCKVALTRVSATRAAAQEIRRQRICQCCGASWWTTERPDKSTLVHGTEPEPDSGNRPLVDHGQATERPAVGYVSLDPSLKSVSSSLPALSLLSENQMNYKSMEVGRHPGDRPPPPPAPPPNRFMRAFALFCEVWRTKYGVPYRPTGADRSQLGRLLSTLTPEDLEELPRAFNAYLADRAPFVMRQMRHNLAFFCTSGGFNKYRTPDVMVASQREVDNHVAGEQWLAMEASVRNGHGRR